MPDPALTDSVPPEPQPATPGVQRIDQLDSLRGVAALLVFTAHCFLLYPVMTPLRGRLAMSPLRLGLDGHPAVLFFFLLSGFVLYLPYKRGRQAAYGKYLTRRICRVYLPYLAGIGFAGAMSVIFYRPVAAVGTFYSWQHLGHRALLRTALLFSSLILPYAREVWNTSTWSLAEEMRISIVFPLIALAVSRWRTHFVLLGVLAASVLCGLGVHAIHHKFPFYTLHYAGMFAVGALLARYHELLTARFRRLPRTVSLALAIPFMAVYLYAVFLQPYLPSWIAEETTDLLVTASNCFLLLAALGSPWFRAALLFAPVQVLGRISYSFYLLHIPVLFTAVALLWARVPHWQVFILALAVNTLLAMASYRWIELPCVTLGKRLTHAAR